MFPTIITFFQQLKIEKTLAPICIKRIIHFFQLLVSFIFIIMLFNLNIKAG